MPPAKIYSELSGYLESMIASGYFAPGEKLPVQRELCEQFGLTKGTVGRALKELEDRGLVELRHGSGCFVCRRENSRKHCNLVLYTESDLKTASYCGRVIAGIQQRAAELGIGLMIHFIPVSEIAGSPARQRQDDFDAVLLVGPYDLALQEFSCRKPCVGVNMHRNFGHFSTLEMDPLLAAELAAGFLRRHGARQVMAFAAAGGNAAQNVFQYRRQCFQAVWGEDFTFCPQDEDDDLAFLEKLPADTGLWFSSDHRYHRICKRFRQQTGRVLTDLFPVISNDGRNFLVPDQMPVTSILPDYQDMGRGAVDEAIRRIECPGSPPRRIYQNVTLKEYPFTERGV